MMAAARTFLETQFQQRTAQLVEPDVGAGAAGQVAAPVEFRCVPGLIVENRARDQGRTPAEISLP